ncbi:hypothetical protein A1356_10180 [Methylomonas koyamae]|uniref:Uncharacterized protein n=1 Tax=Methylomonas koyamae TaxID=702114 RepID=A0AA91DDE3_9GAMM|nr:hypothetical protein A1356_10180 [Methylomonas koyamae]
MVSSVGKGLVFAVFRRLFYRIHQEPCHCGFNRIQMPQFIEIKLFLLYGLAGAALLRRRQRAERDEISPCARYFVVLAGGRVAAA